MFFNAFINAGSGHAEGLKAVERRDVSDETLSRLDTKNN